MHDEHVSKDMHLSRAELAETPASGAGSQPTEMIMCWRALISIVAIVVTVSANAAGQSLNVSDHPDAPVVRLANGTTYRVVNGAAYQVQGALMNFAGQLYDPNFYATNYETISGVTYRVSGSNLYPVRTSMHETFETASTLPQLIGSPPRNWTAFTLQGPATPTVQQYVALRNAILAGQSGFRDNRVEPSTAAKKAGKRSLRAYAYPASTSLPVSKASLDTELLHFTKGDHFWLTMWFGIAQGTPTGIVDLESTWIVEWPGMRVLFDTDLRPRVELKWADKPTYRAAPTVTVPRNKWVHLKLHLHLSDVPTEGHVELWLDGVQVINATGQTLPLPDTVYNSLEVGVTGNASRTAAEVYIDEVRFDKGAL